MQPNEWPDWIRSWPCDDKNCDGKGTVCRGAYDHGDGDVEWDISQCRFCAEREELARHVESQTAEIEQKVSALRLIAEVSGDAYDLRQIARSALHDRSGSLPEKGSS